jgi:hypothetical protein
MAVPTPLSKKLREALGSDAGEDLVTWLQEMRAEHEEKLAAIHADFAQYRHETLGSESRLLAHIHNEVVALTDRIHGVETSLADRMRGVETKLDERIVAVATKLDERIGKVDLRVADVKADLMKWSLVFWVGAVGAIAALAGVLRN